METQTVCSICNQESLDNVNPEKILTCGSCVIILHEFAQKKPSELIRFHNSLIEKGLLEKARSVEAFIVPEVNGEIATFENTIIQRGIKGGSKGYQRGFFSGSK